MSSSDGACALAALSWWASALCLPFSLPDEVRRYAACTRAQVSVTGGRATSWCADAYRRAEHERGADLRRHACSSVEKYNFVTGMRDAPSREGRCSASRHARRLCWQSACLRGGRRRVHWRVCGETQRGGGRRYGQTWCYASNSEGDGVEEGEQASGCGGRSSGVGRDRFPRSASFDDVVVHFTQ